MCFHAAGLPRRTRLDYVVKGRTLAIIALEISGKINPGDAAKNFSPHFKTA
jgi:hypothetical protein